MRGVHLLLHGCLLWVFLTGTATAFDTEHAIEADGITMSWAVAEDSLLVELRAQTTGWLAVGFNPSEQMKDANYIIGYVKDGEVVVHDEFGDGRLSHKKDIDLGGSSDITILGGKESKGQTTLQFSIPLDSKDPFDVVLDPQGETVILLAYGGKRDSLRSMHAYRVTRTVSLSAGE